MMSKEQYKVVMQVYLHLLENEKRGWDGLDDYMEYLDYLDNDQIHRESDVIYSHHSRGNVRCQQNHSKEKCFVPLIVEAVGAILELYKETGNMHEKNRYVLAYYLSMNQAQLILMEP
jgi:hypothetical protein